MTDKQIKNKIKESVNLLVDEIGMIMSPIVSMISSEDLFEHAHELENIEIKNKRLKKIAKKTIDFLYDAAEYCSFNSPGSSVLCGNIMKLYVEFKFIKK
jgi:hypothetical protein